jgi:hypothetical protein
VMRQPLSAAWSDYSKYILRDGVHLAAYPDGDVLNGPGSAVDGPGGGHRSSRRPGGLRRLRHRRPPAETTNAGQDAAPDAGPAPRSAENRAPHRVQGAQRAQPAERAEQPGITGGSGRPGPGRVRGTGSRRRKPSDSQAPARTAPDRGFRQAATA